MAVVQPLFHIRDLSFTYRHASHPALHGITYTHQAGEFTAIIGATGAGKSTLCRCLNGLIPAFIKGTLSGELTILGERMTGRPVYDVARRVGLVFQDFEAQLFSTNVELEVAFGLENFAVPYEQMRDRVREALGRVGLTGFEGRDPSTLSGGEKQRLAIASILVSRPMILVMDEPTTDLDPIGKRDVFHLARALRQEIQGIILVEHETEHVLTADRLVLMREGRILADERPQELLSDPGLLETNGVRPLQTTVLLRRLGLPTTGLDVDTAFHIIQDAGWRADPAAVARLHQPISNLADHEPVIDVNAVSYQYDAGPAALDAVSLTIRRGEFVAIIGQNGCGKTTLVKQFNGLLRPTKGSIRMLGREASSWSLAELGRRVGYVFQNPDHQIFANTVQEEVAFGPRNFGLPEPEIDARVVEALQVVGLRGREDEDPFSLTKGERQQLAVASVLASDPEILILDEPTTGLDYHGQRSILDLIRRLNQTGRTIIIVTHSMWVVAEYAHRCVMMQRGRIVADGDIRESFKDPARLADLALEAPEAVRLGARLGVPVRSVDELYGCLTR
ncbi:MAG: ATP-binding cassette domain-containing protein [Candidatus Latescibacteria bacterium]|nr:ATP-binding cassette domain-containing protein [Candidatus Latescibacterota bacterium]